jgi:phage-related protein
VSMYGAIIQAGLNLLIAFLTGLKEAIPQIVTLVIEIIAGFINAIASNLGQIIAAGVNLLLAFIQGIIDNLPRIVEAVGTLITTLITELGNLQNRIIDAGFELLKNFIKGIADNLIELAAAATDVVVRFCTEITNNVDKVVTAGGDMIIKLIQGFTNKASEVVDAGLKAVVKFCEGLAKDTIEFVNAAADILTNFLEALAASIRVHGPELRDAGIDVVAAIISGMTFGLSDKVKSVADGAVNLAKSAVNAAKGWLGISSPSKVFMQIGGQMAQGLAIGLDRDISAEQSAIGLVQRTTAAFEESFAAITASLGDMTELNPVITPILDLTRLASDAQLIGDYIQTSQKLSPEYSYAQARTIATSANAQQSEEIQAPAGAGEVTFNQTINSPTQLSATEIYKQTRNQITMAKQELSIP